MTASLNCLKVSRLTQNMPCCVPASYQLGASQAASQRHLSIKKRLDVIQSTVRRMFFVTVQAQQ